MNILVYGSGSVGITFGTALVAGGEDVTILARGESRKLIETLGMGYSGVVGHQHAMPSQFKIVNALSAALTHTYDAILCCTKVSNLADWKDDILALAAASPKSRLVFMQNGWGINDHFSHAISNERMANAGIQLGITRSTLNAVHINSAGEPSDIGRIGLADHDPVIDRLLRSINAGGISCRFDPDIGSALWKKMLYNCTTNAPSTLLNLHNGGLGGHDGRALMGLLVDEIYAVIHALGYHPPLPSAAEFADMMVREMIPLTAEHISSMLQDRRLGKPTEIEFLNGAVVRVAEEFGIPCVANKVIYHLVKMLPLGQ